MQGVRLEGGLVFEQAIENVNGFPHPAGYEVAKERNIRTTNVVVRDAPKTAVAHMTRAQ
jgi:hypothetical protein